MNIFVTGSNGYIGRNFIKKASKKNIKIFAVTSKKKNKKIRNVKWLVGNIEKNWKELKKSDILIHFATVGAYNKTVDFNEAHDFNVLKSSKLLMNAINNNCKKWIIISTNKEEKIEKLIKLKKIKNTFTKELHYNYALTKHIFSELCKTYSKIFNIQCRILRLFHVYGNDEPNSRLWKLLNFHSRNHVDLKMSSGYQKYDFNHIEDVTTGLIDALNFRKKNNKFPQVWDFASGKSMSVRTFAKKIWKKNNSKGKILFSKIKNFDKENYLTNKKRLWKINLREL